MASLLEKLVGTRQRDEDDPYITTHAREGREDKEDVVDEQPSSGYKTVVEGTGAGYGDLKEYLEGDLGQLTEGVNRHVTSTTKPIHGVHVYGADQEVEGKLYHDKDAEHNRRENHHSGPLQKMKHKVKASLQKVRGKKSREHYGEGSFTSSASEDNGGGQETDHRA